MSKFLNHRKFMLMLALVGMFIAQEVNANEEAESRSELIRRFQELKSKLFDEFSKDGDKTDTMMDDFFSNSDKLMNDIDQNLFKSFGWGADFSSNIFKSRWRDEKQGRTFLITPQKDAEINIKVEDCMIHIDATEKKPNGITKSKVSLSVDSDLDCNKASKAVQKGNDIEIFFPFSRANLNPLKSEELKQENAVPLKKSKDVENNEKEMVPIIPREDYDVI